MTAPTPADIWASADYAPTADRLAPVSDVIAARLTAAAPAGSRILDLGAGHGHLAATLLSAGFSPIAVDPTEAMIAVGRNRVPGAAWVCADGERTGLEDSSVAAIGSSFAAMFCDEAAGPAEWARVLAPGGVLVMSAWDERGFLAEMTDRMMEATVPAAARGQRFQPPHMMWGDDDVARERLSRDFASVEIEHLDLPWDFDSVEDGMELYLSGSPTHTFSLEHAGDRREPLLDALRGHLEECAGPDGRIRATAGYSLITARL